MHTPVTVPNTFRKTFSTSPPFTPPPHPLPDDLTIERARAPSEQSDLACWRVKRPPHERNANMKAFNGEIDFSNRGRVPALVHGPRSLLPRVFPHAVIDVRAPIAYRSSTDLCVSSDSISSLRRANHRSAATGRHCKIDNYRGHPIDRISDENYAPKNR